MQVISQAYWAQDMYIMVVGNHQCNAANLNHSEPQFQLELSLAQFSPSLFESIVTGDWLQSLCWSVVEPMLDGC